MDPDVPPVERLQRLLALKRHEVPPPGFFDAFPDRVRARILAAETTPAVPWWERLQGWSGWRPALAGACLVAACGLWLWPRTQGPDRTAGRGTGREGFTENATMAAPAFPWSQESPVRRADAVNSMAPQGLFTPGIGLRGALSPVAATSAVSGLVLTGAPQATLPALR